MYNLKANNNITHGWKYYEMRAQIHLIIDQCSQSTCTQYTDYQIIHKSYV